MKTSSRPVGYCVARDRGGMAVTCNSKDYTKLLSSSLALCEM